ETLSSVPTVGESVPGYEAIAWQGIGAPKNTPTEIVDKLNREINAAIADPKIKARFAGLGNMVLAGSPADFEKLIDEETKKWAKVIHAANIKAELSFSPWYALFAPKGTPGEVIERLNATTVEALSRSGGEIPACRPQLGGFPARPVTPEALHAVQKAD